MLGGLKRQKCVPSQIWRLGVCSQGVPRISSFWKLSGKICSLLSPNFWWLWAVLSVPWLGAASQQSLSL